MNICWDSLSVNSQEDINLGCIFSFFDQILVYNLWFIHKHSIIKKKMLTKICLPTQVDNLSILSKSAYNDSIFHNCYKNTVLTTLFIAISIKHFLCRGATENKFTNSGFYPAHRWYLQIQHSLSSCKKWQSYNQPGLYLSLILTVLIFKQYMTQLS